MVSSSELAVRPGVLALQYSDVCADACHAAAEWQSLLYVVVWRRWPSLSMGRDAGLERPTDLDNKTAVQHFLRRTLRAGKRKPAHHGRTRLRLRWGKSGKHLQVVRQQLGTTS